MKRYFSNHYFKFLYNVLHRIGVKRTKQIVYTTNSHDNVIINNGQNHLQSISIRCCTKEDIMQCFDDDKQLRFYEDLDQGHIMVGGFFNGDLVAYSWLSHQKAYMSDIKKWVDFEGGYVWRGATKEKKRYRGIGLKLLRYSLKLAEAQGKRNVYALTDIDNTSAQRALESTGFQKQKIVSYSTFFNLERRSERTMEKDEVL